MKRAFVTGATGFIGLNLIEKLLSEQWQVTALHLPGEDLKYLSRFKVKVNVQQCLVAAGITFTGIGKTDHRITAL